MKINWKAIFALVVMLPIAAFATIGCGGSSETTIPDGAANVQAPTDNPAEEDANELADGP